MHVTYQVYTFINIINLSIQIYPYKTKLDLPRVCLNGRLNSYLTRLMLFISVPFMPFSRFLTVYPLNKTVYHYLSFTGCLNGRLIRLGEHCP